MACHAIVGNNEQTELKPEQTDTEPVRGLLCGLAAGLAATWAMTQFQRGWLKALKSASPEQHHDQRQHEQGEHAPVKVARVLSRTVLDHDVPPARRERAGTFVHYAFGTLMGGIYGVTTEYVPQERAGFGLL